MMQLPRPLTVNASLEAPARTFSRMTSKASGKGAEPNLAIAPFPGVQLPAFSFTACSSM